MKKIAQIALASSLSLLLLTACSSGEKGDGVSKKETSGLSVEILEGEFVTPPDKTNRSSKDYIAVKVKLKNNTDSTVEIFTSDLTLYDEDGEEVEPSMVWDNTESVHMLDTTSLSKGKTSTGYVIYEVSKKVTDYEMKVSAFKKGKGSMDDLEVEVKFSTDEFVDKREQALELAKTYINGVFLNGNSEIKASESTALSSENGKADLVSLSHKSKTKSKDKDKTKVEPFELGNDIEEEREDFIKNFVNDLDGNWDYYKPTEEERTKLALAYINENAKRAEVDFKIKSYLPGVVTVYVRPNLVDLSTIDTYNLIRDYVKSKGDSAFSDYSAAQKEAEKYIFDKLPEYFATASLSTPSYMPTEGYAITFVEDDGVWIFDSSERYNFDYENLVEAFSGS